MAYVHQWLHHRLTVPVAVGVCALTILLVVYTGVELGATAMVVYAVVILLSVVVAWVAFVAQFTASGAEDRRSRGVLARENALGAWMQAHSGRLRAVRQSLSETRVSGPIGVADRLALARPLDDAPAPRTPSGHQTAPSARADQAPLALSGMVMRKRSAIPVGAGFAAPPRTLPTVVVEERQVSAP